MGFTDSDRQAGYEAMAASITPLSKALRKFTAGKPSASHDDTPLGVVFLAVEQRERLRKILKDESGLKRPQVTATAIVGRLAVKGSPAILDGEIISVEEGRESYAVGELEGNQDCGHKFTISGFMFAVRAGKEERLFSYRIERNPEGEAALKFAGEKLLKRA